MNPIHELQQDSRMTWRSDARGCNSETGSVASVVWVSNGSADDVTAFIDIDGQSLVGG